MSFRYRRRASRGDPASLSCPMELRGDEGLEIAQSSYVDSYLRESSSSPIGLSKSLRLPSELEVSLGWWDHVRGGCNGI